ncbi:MAG TPA: hypothetical protein VFU15_08380 [Bacteroidia bacterium]|nr:hypothetical protein [Bacteroidia bacterium]
MKLSIVTEAPAWYVLFCVAAGLLYSGILYYRENRNTAVPRWLKNVMAVTRFTVIFILTFLLLGPMLKTIFREVQKPVIVLAQDASGSILMNKDSAFYRSQYPGKINALVEALSDKYDVQTYSFGDHFREKTDFSFRDKQTDFTSLFDEIESRYSDRNLGAVIVASDGIYNEGQSPVYAAEKIHAPVFAIALGDTTVRKDLILTKVVHNRIAFLGNTFPIEVVADAHRCMGEKSILTVTKGGQTLASKPVDINADPFDITIPVELTASSPGLQRYTVTLSVINGETNVQNNTQDFFIDVLDSREKILIVCANPHPDVGALKEAIETNDNYQVETYTLAQFDKPVDKYNLAILHGIPSDQAPGQKLIADLAAANIPVWYITGASGRFSGFNSLGAGVNVQVSGSSANDCEAYPADGFPLFNLSSQATDYIPKFPALTCPFANYQVSPAVNPLMKQKIGVLKTDYPLWVFSQEGTRKVGIIFGEGIWKWRLHDYADHGNHDIFNELVGKTVQYLSVRDDKSFFRVSSKTNYLENESVQFDAEVYNQSYELINTPVVTIDIISEDGKRSPRTFTATANAYHLDAGQFPVGEYSYEATTKVGDKVYTQKGKFSVSPLFIEIANTTANHQVLFNLCHRHNGEMVAPSSIDKLVQILNSREDIKPVIYNPKKLVDLINLWWFFLVLMGFLTLEWFMRKRNGLY